MIDKHPATITAQALGAYDEETGGVVPGIHPATTFKRDPDYQSNVPGYVYARDDSNPAFGYRQGSDVVANQANRARKGCHNLLRVDTTFTQST